MVFKAAVRPLVGAKITSGLVDIGKDPGEMEPSVSSLPGLSGISTEYTYIEWSTGIPDDELRRKCYVDI